MPTSVIQLGKLALALHTKPAKKQKPAPAPVNHIIAIDISGSMYGDLPKLRTHLKNKLATLVNPLDTVSLIWFSGKAEAGTLVEAMKIYGVKDLSKLHTAIDRYLVPTGLTGFKDPLKEVEKLVDKLATANPGLSNMLFMTDGYDNQWTQAEILELCTELSSKLDNAAIIEYGWNCNRPLLTKMADALGGKVIFSEDFDSYTVTFEASLRGSTKKSLLKLAKPATQGFVFGFDGTNLLSFIPNAANEVLVPEGINAVAYLTSAAGVAYDKEKHTHPLVFAAVAAQASRMLTDNVFELLGAIGDVALVDKFVNCFSKEDYSRFNADTLAAAGNESLRYAGGYSTSAVPKEDAYTVLEMLADLSSSPDNLMYPYHPAFHYEKTSAATVAKDESVKFEVMDKAKGYPLDGLVWNEDRPNVSLRIKVDGKVALPADRPAPLPASVDTFIYRAYTIVRDGIVHTRQLPVSLNEATFNKLQANGLLAGEKWAAGKVFVLAYPTVPVINRQMVKGVTAKDTMNAVLELALLKGAQKVYGDWLNKVAPKTSKGFTALYGQEGADYLKALGLTDYSGFNPPSVTVKSGDFYMATELTIAAKGLSSLPKVADVAAAVEAGKKLKIGEFVMVDATLRVKEFMESPIYKSAADANALLGAWLTGEQANAVAKTREKMTVLAKQKFAIVVGHTWFSDATGIDDNSREMELPGYGPVTVSATLKEIQIAI